MAVIVGAGPGIGGSVAKRFAALGFDIGLISRDEGQVKALAAEVEAAGPEGTGVGWGAVDVADAERLHATIARMVEHTGRVDVLHVNPSAFRPARPRDLTAADLLADLAVGVAPLLTAVQAVLPKMLEQRTGTILATGSGVADRPDPGAASLGVQKAGLRNLVRTLAEDLRPEGIHVATLTVHGLLDTEGPFSPARIADALVDLAAETAGDPAHWRTVADLTAEGVSPPRAVPA